MPGEEYLAQLGTRSRQRETFQDHLKDPQICPCHVPTVYVNRKWYQVIFRNSLFVCLVSFLHLFFYASSIRYLKENLKVVHDVLLPLYGATKLPSYPAHHDPAGNSMKKCQDARKKNSIPPDNAQGKWSISLPSPRFFTGKSFKRVKIVKAVASTSRSNQQVHALAVATTPFRQQFTLQRSSSPALFVWNWQTTLDTLTTIYVPKHLAMHLFLVNMPP